MPTTTTAQQIWDAVRALMLEPAGEGGVAPYFLALLNLLLAETLTLENGLREAEGLPALERAPRVTALSQEVPYREALTRVALPYGAAGLLYAEEDPSAAVAYKNKYEYERARLLRGRVEPVADYYGGMS